MPLEVEVLDESGQIDEALLAQVLNLAFELVDRAPAGAWSCSVRIAGAETIAALHGQFFGDPSDTDVMSFPSGELSGSRGGYLGDVAISIDMARLQAREAGHSLRREVAYLSLHGMLHLLGYDDQEDNERTAMLHLQDSVLSAIEQEIGQPL